MSKFKIGDVVRLHGEEINRQYQNAIVKIVNVGDGECRIEVIDAPNGGKPGAKGTIDNHKLHFFAYTNKDAIRFLRKR